jgi:thiamine transport system ATP-binding protein
MLQINELIFKWPNSIQQEVNLEASAGEIVLIGGPSGIGKTTLFNIISGFYETVSGSVIFNGKNLISKPPWKRPVSTMFQSDNLFPHLSVKQNLMLGIKNFSKDIENQLYFLKIFSLINQKCSELSGGELQRVALIKTLSREKPIILLDEPFSALDEDMIKKASILIQEYTKRMNSITLIISHQDASAYLAIDQRIQLG